MSAVVVLLAAMLSGVPAQADDPATAALITVVAGGAHTCGIDTGGDTYCWGSGAGGELGDGETADQSRPVAVDGPAGVRFTQLALGNGHTCALGDDSKTYCWGNGDSSPVVVAAPAGVTFTRITAGDYDTCALGDDATAYCWGQNADGELGDGTTTNRPAPVAVSAPAGVTFTQLSAGGLQTCGLGDDTKTYCWGYGGTGALGNGSTASQLTPTAVDTPPGVTFTALAGGYPDMCALGDDTKAYCWGANGNAQLGNGTTTDRSTPVAVSAPAGVTFTALAPDYAHSCALGDDSKVYCWGWGNSGELGNDGTAQLATPVPVNAPAGVGFTHLTSGTDHTCALGDDGATYCWGAGTNGELGNGEFADEAHPVPVLAPTATAGTQPSPGLQPPAGVTAAAAARAVKVSWTAVPDPHDPRSAYTATASPGGKTCTTSGTACTITSLSPGTEYTVTVVTSLYSETSAASDPSATVTPAESPFSAIVQVVAGGNHTCGIGADANTYCWGSGSAGQLGNGDTADWATPMLVDAPPGVRFSHLTLGADHTCALGDDSKAYCWGDGGEGQLGDGSATEQPDPVAVAVPAGVTFTQISAGGFDTCALGDDANAYCWGQNAEGVLGDGTTTNRSAPVAVDAPAGVRFTGLAAGGEQTCALGEDTKTYCWGYGHNGAMGNGATADQLTPAAVDTTPGVTLTDLTGGYGHTCAIGSDSGSYCWGFNGNGQAGSGSTGNLLTPTAVGGGALTSVSAGYVHSCGLGADTKTYCWGASGTLGDGGDEQHETPVAVDVPSGVTLSQVTSGYGHACGLGDDGTTYCWGAGTNGQLGNDEFADQLSPVAVQAPPATVSGLRPPTGVTATAAARSIKVSWTAPQGSGTPMFLSYTATASPGGKSCTTMGTACTITSLTAGTGYTVTVATMDVTGASATSTRSAPATPTASPVSPIVQVVAGGVSTCGIGADANTYCWGGGGQGQLGNGDTVDWSGPEAVEMPAGVTFTQLAVGGDHTCAAGSDAKAYCWGSGYAGQLGNGGTGDLSAPAVVTAPAGVRLTGLSVGGSDTCGLGGDGTAYCWGENDFGQLGNGSTTNAPAPVPVAAPSGVTFTELAAGGEATCGLGSNTKIYCWGYGFAGRLGNGATANHSTPVAVDTPAGVTFTDLVSGSATTCALGSDGNPWCWGFNGNGQLGNGTTADQPAPVAISAPAGVRFTSMAPGNAHSCGLGDNGKAYCWGWGADGELGNDDEAQHETPVAVDMPAGVTFTQLTSGNSHTCGLGDDGTTYCWGAGTNGELGDTDSLDRSHPVAVLAPPASLSSPSPSASPSPTPSPTPSASPTPTTKPSPSTTPSPTQTASPNPPTGVTVAPGDHTVTVSWSAPDLLGQTLVGYTATAAPGGNSCTVSGGQGALCSIDGLTNGTQYTVTVTTTTKSGTSSASAPSAGVTPKSGTPAGLQPPTLTGAKPADQAIAVSWLPGALVGTLLGYTAKATATNAPCSSATSPCVTTAAAAKAGTTADTVRIAAAGDEGSCTITDGQACTITGLTNGVSYVISVITHTTAGDSAPQSTTPATTPTTSPAPSTSPSPSPSPSGSPAEKPAPGLPVTGAPAATIAVAGWLMIVFGAALTLFLYDRRRRGTGAS